MINTNIYNNGGNVGIGIATSPTDKLTVNDGNLGIYNDNNTAGTLKFYEPSTSGSNYIAFQAPALAASVTYSLPSADGSSGQVLSTNGSGALSWSSGAGWALTGNSGTTSLNWLGTISNQSLYIRTNNTQRMIIDSLGNVGIGTTSIVRKFNIVQSDPAHGTVMLQNTSSTGYSSLDFLDNTGTTQGNVGYANGSAGWNPGTFYFNTNTSAPMTFGANSAEVFRLTNSGGTGYMGIGTTATPADRLTLNDGNLGISNDDNTARSLKFYEPSTSGSNYTSFKAPVMAATVSYTLPSADGTSGQFLSTDGSGNLSWSNATGIGIPTFVFVSGSNFTTTSTSMTNITGLSQALVVSAKYEFEAVMEVSASGNNGLNFAVNYSGTGTNTLAALVNGLVDLGAGGHDLCLRLNTLGTGHSSGSFVTVASTDAGVYIKGTITTGATTPGNLTIQILSKNSSNTATVYTGSYLKVTRIQ